MIKQKQMTEQELDQVVGGGKIKDLIDKAREKRKNRKNKKKYGLPEPRPIHDDNCPEDEGAEDEYTPIIII